MQVASPHTIAELETWEAEIAEQIERLQQSGANGKLAETRLTFLQEDLCRCQRRRAELEQELTCNAQES